MPAYSHAIPIKVDLPPGPLWEWKHNTEELEEMERADPYNFSAQYKQQPSKKGGSSFKRDWWKWYKVLPDYQWKAIFADTALKAGEENDYTVFQCWAKYWNKIYLVDQFREKIESVYLKKQMIDFWNKHNTSVIQPLRMCYVEDKASGTQLIQDIQLNGGIPIKGIPRGKGQGKVERVNNLNGWIESGLVVLPEEAPWIYDYTNEFQLFSPLMTHKNDDQIDPTLDAIQEMLINAPVEDLGSKRENEKKHKNIAPAINSDKMW